MKLETDNQAKLPEALSENLNQPTSVQPTCYLHPGYAESLREFGEPLELPNSGGWLLKRRIPGTDLFDAMGCYPLFCCRDWSKLGKDLSALQNKLVSVALVTDPFGAYDAGLLERTFDRVLRFKEHFVADLSQPLASFASVGHRKRARKALRDMTVELVPEPLTYLDEWMKLYAGLIERHQIKGIRRFSRESFAKQLAVPGLILFRASRAGETLGLNLIYLAGDVAYAHLVALSPQGYELHAAYALKKFVLRHLADQVRWVDFGATVGLEPAPGSGLSDFKRGWSSTTRPAFFCGKILSEHAYQLLERNASRQHPAYFPAYRDGEFAALEISSGPESSTGDAGQIPSGPPSGTGVAAAKAESSEPPPSQVHQPVAVPGGKIVGDGYRHPLYAESLREFGEPVELPNCGGWLLSRQIPGTQWRDAMGCYPLFGCSDWGQLEKDLRTLEDRLVSLALVTDPFASYDPERFKECFDTVFKFKEHYVSSVDDSPEKCVTRHHRYYAKKSLEQCQVEVVENPLEHLDEWVNLYASLIKRHGLTGIKAFSKNSFARQFEIPGLVMLRMTAGTACIGAQLWLVHDGVAHSHLTAFNEAGYNNRASYGMYWRAIEILRTSQASKVRWLNFGAGAGIGGEGTDGLSIFKKGWSTATRTAWFCGRILNRETYARIVESRGLAQDTYFPLYREGEFS